MIVLHLTDTTGPELYAIIETAQSNRSQYLQQHVSKQDFCSVGGISRQQLYNYRDGARPSVESLNNVAAGLRSWGNVVKINFNN